MYTSEHPISSSTSSVIAYHYDFDNTGPNHQFSDRIHILGVVRGREPFKGQVALPGGFIEVGHEDLIHCAARELTEETDIFVDPSQLRPVIVQSSPTRDPRGHVIDHVFAVATDIQGATAGDDAAEITSRTYNRDDWPEELAADSWAFDHGDSIRYFLKSIGW